MIGSTAQFGNPSIGRSAQADSGAEEYCRQARRLRRMYAGRPGILHRRLKELSDAQPRQSFAKSPSLAGNSSAAWEFAERVTARLEAGGLLRYSHRTALLKEAQRLGIKRFEANLIIAVMQHRMGNRGAAAEQSPPPSARRWGWGMVGAALGVQAVIVGCLWWIIRG